MSQFQAQSQSPYVHNISSRIGDDGTVQCDHGKVPLLTSNTPKNYGRQFFTCRLHREDKNRCRFFAWLDEIRQDEDWNEDLFRAAYHQYRPPEDNLAATETPRKRRTSPGSLPGSNVPPKRICHAQPDHLSDEEFFTSPLTSMTTGAGRSHPMPSRTCTTPSRLNQGGLRSTRAHAEWPMTPTSPRTRETQTVVATASPSREGVRRQETRVTAQLQNFDSVSDLSPLSLTPSFQAPQAAQSLPARVASADEVEEVINITNNITVDYVRKLERRSIASQRASDARMARIQQLEAELERSQRQIDQLNNENERFQQEIIKLTRENDRLRSCENEKHLHEQLV